MRENVELKIVEVKAEDEEIIYKFCDGLDYFPSAIMHDVIDNDFGKVFLLYRNDEVVGIIDYWITFDSSTLAMIYIDEKYRRLGYAKKLMNFMFEDLKNEGVKFASLEVREHNLSAKSLYLSLGYEFINVKEQYYKDGEDALYYVKNIEPSPLILAIESSCDETSIAITRNKKILSNVISSQIEKHRVYGGVMPELASRLHIENILYVLETALKDASVMLEEIDAIAFTRGPGLVGALHVGLEVAKTLSYIYDIPLIPVHHLAGHIYANEYVTELKFPLLAVVVSGGNSELVIMRDHLQFDIIGRTVDDAIGECYDKVARVMGLPYPGGVEIDRLAKKGRATYKLPIPHTQGLYDLSFSGLKTHIINLVNSLNMKGETLNKEDLACSFQEVALAEIVKKVSLAAKNFNVKQILVAGGVSANSRLKAMLHNIYDNSRIELFFPPLSLCGDNAAMIARFAHHLYLKGVHASLDVGVDPNWEITDFNNF